MLPVILPLLPEDSIQYVEPFGGGLSVFWSKRPHQNEVVNDIDGQLTNFYWQVKTNFHELQTLIQATLHSEVLYKEAAIVLDDETQSPVRRAWAYWCRTQMAFSFILHGGFAFGELGCGLKTANKRDDFTEKYMVRLREVEILNRDAVEVIKLKDNSENTFFYLDPPYVSSNQGGYAGYTKEHFVQLLETLAAIKGKFLLSSYPEPELMEFREKYGWKKKDIRQIVSVTGKREETKYKTECLTWNYVEPNQQTSLFDFSELELEPEQMQEENNSPI